MRIMDLLRGKKRLRPGDDCPRSGQYTYSKWPHDQRSCNEGDPMPPPPIGVKGGFWRLTDATITDHRRGRRD